MAYRQLILFDGSHIFLILPIRVAKAKYSGEFHEWLLLAEDCRLAQRNEGLLGRNQALEIDKSATIIRLTAAVRPAKADARFRRVEQPFARKPV